MNNIEIIWYKAYFDLKAESARGGLGIFWWVLEPLLYLGALSVVFIAIRQRTDEDFIAFLFVGLVVWKWFASSVSQGSNAIAGHTGLMRQVYIPKYFFSCTVLLVNTFKFSIVFLLLLMALLFLGTEPSLAWLSLPLLILVQMLMLLGIGMTLAWVVCYVPDVKVIVDNCMLFLFFLSGVIFDISKAPEGIREYLYLNPELIMIDAFRAVLLHGNWPDWTRLTGVSLLSVLLVLMGAYLLKKYDRKIPKVVLK